MLGARCQNITSSSVVNMSSAATQILHQSRQNTPPVRLRWSFAPCGQTPPSSNATSGQNPLVQIPPPVNPPPSVNDSALTVLSNHKTS